MAAVIFAVLFLVACVLFWSYFISEIHLIWVALVSLRQDIDKITKIAKDICKAGDKAESDFQKSINDINVELDYLKKLIERTYGQEMPKTIDNLP